MRLTIHQPEHLPWLGFLDKARQVETFVLLDHVQYARRDFQNRNRVLGPEGPLWLTVPVKVRGRFDQRIDEVEIDNEGSPRWAEKHWRTLERCYREAPHFAEHAPFFEALYRRRWGLLRDLNEEIIRYLFASYGIGVRLVRSSALELKERKGELMLEIARALGAGAYLSGISGKDYLEPAAFARAGVTLELQRFHHPVYRQRQGGFAPCMSSVDLLFNHGPAARGILEGRGVERLERLFE